MPPSKTFDMFFLFTSFANYPLSFMSTTTAKKNIRQLKAHRCCHPLSQLSSAVFYVTSPVKLSLLTGLWSSGVGRGKSENLSPPPPSFPSLSSLFFRQTASLFTGQSNLSATSLPGFSVKGERKRENPGREVGLSGELVLSPSVPSLLNHSDQARTALGKRLYRRFYSDNSSTPACPLF